MDPTAQHMEAAQNAILACDYDTGIQYCWDVLTQYPKHVQAACLLAEAYREKGYTDHAEALLRRVLSADPENVLAYWALGLLLRDENREQEAYGTLVRARELAPANVEIVNDMLPLSRDQQAAVKPSRALLGRYYAAMGMYECAADEFRAVLAEKPRRLDVWVALAEVLWRAEEQDEARAVCEAILGESPDCLQALLILAQICRAEGDAAGADSLTSLVYEMDPAGNALARFL